MQRSLESTLTDLNQGFARSKEFSNAWPGAGQQRAKCGIGCIAASEPDDLRRWSEASEQVYEVAILRHDHRAGGTSRVENRAILSVAETKGADGRRVNVKGCLKPEGQHWRRVGVSPDDHAGANSSSDDGMVEATASEAETGGDVREFKIGQLSYDLISGKSGGEEVKNVDDTNAHAANAGSAATLIGVHRYAVHQLNGLAHGLRRWSGRNIAGEGRS